MQTATFVPSRGPQTTSALNPLDKGVCNGRTDADFKREMPREHARWRSDVRHARYPGGESFNDLILRVEGVLIDIEQQTSPVLVVSHLSTLQVPTGPVACCFCGIKMAV